MIRRVVSVKTYNLHSVKLSAYSYPKALVSNKSRGVGDISANELPHRTSTP